MSKVMLRRQRGQFGSLAPEGYHQLTTKLNESLLIFLKEYTMICLKFVVFCAILSLGLIVGVRAFAEPKADFLLDIDGQSVAMGRNRVCAIEETPGIEFGGRVRCFSKDPDEEEPPEQIFIQVISLFHYSCGLAIDRSVICWGNLAPKSVDGKWKQISGESRSS